MQRDASIGALLQWHRAQVGSDAPPPSAAQLLQRLRPWWEREPAQFRVLATRVHRIPVALGYAKSGPERQRGGGMVPAILAVDLEVETYVRVVYVAVIDGRLRLRFELDVDGADTFTELESTFLADDGASVLLCADAIRSQSGEYRIDAPLPAPLATTWHTLKSSGELPFRLILRPRPAHGGSPPLPAGTV